MQTFLPYRSFVKSAASLDRQRLGKQRVETLQILKALTDASYGWQNHPAVRMWKGHEAVLLDYQVAVCEEWAARGYRDTCLDKSTELLRRVGLISNADAPEWLGNDELHRSHRSNLLRKNPEHYAPLFGAGLPDDLPYVWPVN